MGGFSHAQARTAIHTANRGRFLATHRPRKAQAPRTFVSAACNDSNPCSFAAPCRHFKAAVNATSLGGEGDALDPAGYGPITITQAITIEGQGWSYAAPAANSPAITINAVTGKVYIHGVSLNGVGITGTTTGIQFNSGGSLTVRDSVIRNFSGDGIDFEPTAAGDLFVSNTVASDNANTGIAVFPSGNNNTSSIVSRRTTIPIMAYFCGVRPAPGASLLPFPIPLLPGMALMAFMSLRPRVNRRSRSCCSIPSRSPITLAYSQTA